MKALRYITVLGLLCIPLGVLGRRIYLDGYYYEKAPRTRDPVKGAIVPLTFHHGTKVFITEEQWRRDWSPKAESIELTAFVLGTLGAFVLNRRWKVLRNSGDEA